MNLYFMRHGIAADRDETAYSSADRERVLTPKGIKRMTKAAKGLIALSLSFDRILTSPLARARQTAEIVAQTLGLDERVVEIEQLAPAQSAQDLVSALAAHASQKEVLVIGHEPLLSGAVSFLLSGTAEMDIRLKKGGLCCVEVGGFPPRERAVLHWMLTPKQLRFMAR